jgi:hypothetical protein
VKGGPNENAIINLSGLIGPLTSDVGVFIKVSAGRRAGRAGAARGLPPEVLKASGELDADGRVYTRNSAAGSSAASIVRSARARRRSGRDDVELKIAAGKMAGRSRT